MILQSVFLITFLNECSFMYGNHTIQLDNLRYYTHNFFKTCFAGDYMWTSDTNYAVLDIPDICDGYRCLVLDLDVGI